MELPPPAEPPLASELRFGFDRSEPSIPYDGFAPHEFEFPFSVYERRQRAFSVYANVGESKARGKHACGDCAYACPSSALLKIHERVHSGEKPFACELCDYKSGQKNNVAKHALVHTKKKPYGCQFCEYRCAQKNNLVVHERTHTGVKPFACTFCEYKTVQKPNLVKHMYLHTNEKPYACDLCDYRCVQKTNLNKHRQKHTSEKPFRCDECDYRSSQKSNLNKHRSIHDKYERRTADARLACEYCGFSGELSRHACSIHPFKREIAHVVDDASKFSPHVPSSTYPVKLELPHANNF